MDQMRIFDEFENIPPLLPSQASKADVQRDEGTGGISVCPPVSLPFSTLSSPVWVGTGLKKGGYFHDNRLNNSSSTCQMSVMVFSSTRSLVEWGSTIRGPMLAI